MAQATNPRFRRLFSRARLQRTIERWVELPLLLLSLVMLALLIIEFAVTLDSPWDDLVIRAQIAIWAVFAVDFVVEFLIAPGKLHFVRRNWIAAIAVVLPVFRVFRALRALRVLRGMRAVRTLTLTRAFTVTSRASRALGSVLRRYQFAYVASLTVVVTFAAAALVFYFERNQPDANIRTFGDALWWAVTIVTTVNSPLETVTLEGRIVALVIRLFGLAIIGYITAMIAVVLLGRSGVRSDERDDEISGLRREVQRLNELIEEQGRRAAR